MTVSTAYAYSSTIYPGTVKPASSDTGSTGSGSGSGKPADIMAATDLRQDVGVEVTLSPAALQLLAQQAAAADTPDLEAQITETMKQVLRSEERRVGTASVSTDRLGWSPYLSKKTRP